MDKQKIREMIELLLHEIEEEDIGISLFTTFYKDDGELEFFRRGDRDKILKILKLLSDDSRRHKTFLAKVVSHLGGKCHER